MKSFDYIPRLALGLCAASLLLALSGCGGEDGGPRPTESPALPLAEDPGSGPIDCPVQDDDGSWVLGDDRFEFDFLETFPYGAAERGWYTNNARCYQCELVWRRCNGLDEGGNPGRSCLEIEGIDREAYERYLDNCWAECEAIQSPSHFEKPLFAEAIPSGGRCGSEFALHLEAGPFDQVQFAVDSRWGGIIGLEFAQPGFDASFYDGIAFWGRRNPASRNAIRLDVTDRYTNQDYVSPETGEALCEGNTTPDDTSEGCDKFGTPALLGPDWQLYTLPFAEMRQAGWGKHAPNLDVWGLLSVGFSYNEGAWDFWIDDIAFYTRRPR